MATSPVDRAREWVEGHALTLVALAFVGVVAVCIYSVNDRREADTRTLQARQEADARLDRQRVRDLWQANLRGCQEGNVSRAVLRDFLVAATAPPDPRQFEFIADPQLRAGAFEQATRSRAEMRTRAEVFGPRDCVAAYPEPPG